MLGRWCAALCVAGAVLSTAGGCASYADRLRDVRRDYYAGNLDTAAHRIDGDINNHGGEADVFKLDKAIVELSDGHPRDAQKLLREVRDRFDYLEQKDVAEKAVVMLTDDTTAAYPGEDYEKVLIRAFLALSSLMAGDGDAQAYALQIDDKQQKIIEAGTDETGKNPKLSYKHVALGAYIHGALCEESCMNYDDAERCFVKVCSWQEGFPYAQQDLERVRHGHHSQPGHGVLYVFALVGRGPEKEQAIEPVSSVSLLIADRILSATTKHSLPPTIAPIKVPKVVVHGSTTSTVVAAVDHQPAGQTATITDVGTLAAEQYKAIYPNVLARAIVRRVLKKGIIYGAKEVAKVNNNSPINLAMDVAGVAWEATEVADTRCWGLLPSQIQVVRLEVPAGEHVVDLQPADSYSDGARATSGP